MDPSISDRDRLDAISALTEVDPAGALPLLQDLAGDADSDITARVWAAVRLARNHPEQAAPVLVDLGDIGEVEPSQAVDLFTIWMEISPQEGVSALVSYIRTIASSPFTLDELSQREKHFPRLVTLLRQADQARCSSELELIIHNVDFGVLREEAENLWPEVDRERGADHLAALARGSHEPCEGMQEIWGAPRGDALLALARMGDSRAPEIAEEFVKAGHLSANVNTYHLRHAIMAIAEWDQDRSADLLAEFSHDSRLDAVLRQEFLLELWWVSESRFIDAVDSLSQDSEMRELWASSTIPSMDHVQSCDILSKIIRDASVDHEARANAVKHLLHEDPTRAVAILTELSTSSQQKESAWAHQNLADALDALEVGIFADAP
jgi:hypothetical protein